MLGERLIAEVGERIATPERKRLRQAHRPLLGMNLVARLFEYRLKPRRVQLARVDTYPVPRRVGLDAFGTDQLAQGGNVSVQSGEGGSRRPLAP